MSFRDFASYAGPGDKDLPMSEVSGYQPVSRIGEVVMNAFGARTASSNPHACTHTTSLLRGRNLTGRALCVAVDSYEFAALADSLDGAGMGGPVLGAGANHGQAVEHKPMFHEWATVTPGMICLARKKKTAVFRQYVAAETAVPVIGCAACLPMEMEKDFFFAGVCRSKTVRGPDDGIGPSVDEFFTVAIGGMVTVLNTSGGPLHPGDLVEWCFIAPRLLGGAELPAKRQKTGPRRVGIKMASVSSAKVIGRVLSFAKSGETLDLLLKQ